RNVRVVDGRGERAARADVVIEGGRIRRIAPDLAVPDGGRALDLDGATVVPGLMNAHAHVCLDGNSPDPEALLRDELPAETGVRASKRLLEVLRMGVTSIRDVGAPSGIDIALRRLVEQGDIPGPRMITAGRVVTMTGGHGWWMGWEVDGPHEVRRAVRSQIK